MDWQRGLRRRISGRESIHQITSPPSSTSCAAPSCHARLPFPRIWINFWLPCNSFQLAVFKCLLMSGLRKQELESLTWHDVSFEAGTITVSPKPGFSPKDWEQRTIEVPASLLDLIKALPRKSQWVFANGRGESLHPHVGRLQRHRQSCWNRRCTPSQISCDVWDRAPTIRRGFENRAETFGATRTLKARCGIWQRRRAPKSGQR